MGKRVVQIEIEGTPKDNDLLVYNAQLKCYKQVQKAAVFAYQDNKIKALQDRIAELEQEFEDFKGECNDKINKLAISIKTLYEGEQK